MAASRCRIVCAPGKGYDACKDSPGYPMDSCLQPHHHPRGALYVALEGRALFGGDFDGFDAWIDAGDVRWVRPHVGRARSMQR